MTAGSNGMLMDQKIFELGFSVEVVSVYLLCVGLAESDVELTFTRLMSVWNGTENDLVAGLSELENHSVIEKDTENNVIQLYSSAMWKL